MRLFKWTFKLFILFSSLSFAGQLTDIYKPYIPEQLTKSPQHLSSLESILSTYGRIDPHLIYIYLSDLHMIHFLQQQAQYLSY